MMSGAVDEDINHGGVFGASPIALTAVAQLGPMTEYNAPAVNLSKKRSALAAAAEPDFGPYEGGPTRITNEKAEFRKPLAAQIAIKVKYSSLSQLPSNSL